MFEGRPGVFCIAFIFLFLFSLTSAQCICKDDYDPVCTKDNVTYPSQCSADCADAQVRCKHECPCDKPPKKEIEVIAEGEFYLIKIVCANYLIIILLSSLIILNLKKQLIQKWNTSSNYTCSIVI